MWVKIKRPRRMRYRLVAREENSPSVSWWQGAQAYISIPENDGLALYTCLQSEELPANQTARFFHVRFLLADQFDMTGMTVRFSSRLN